MPKVFPAPPSKGGSGAGRVDAPPGGVRVRALRAGDAATTAVVSFAVVVAVYAVAFAAFLTFLQSPATTHREGASLEVRAEGGLVEMLASAGQTRQYSKAWFKDADNVTRLGLTQDDGKDLLDLDKMRNLTRGSFQKNATNKLLDYEEARSALGLAGFDFHLRSYPIFSTLDESDRKPVRGVDVAYVGNWVKQDSGYSNYPVKYTTSVENKTDHVYVNVTVTNNGTVDTVFQAEFSVPLSSGYLTDTANTPKLAKDPDGDGAGEGGKHTVSLKLYKTSSWTWASSDDKNVSVKINDPKKKVADFKVELTHPMNGYTSNNADYTAVTASPAKLTFKTNQKIKVELDLVKGNGNNQDDIPLTVTLTQPDGTLIQEKAAESGDNVEFNSQSAGWYGINVRRDSDAGFNSTDAIQVTDDDTGEFVSNTDSAWVESSGSQYERALLLGLVENFTNTTYDVNGDVYPDQKQVMNNDLAANITGYDIVIVGSEVDHTAMTSEAAKGAVKDFVFAGGLLIVLGSLDQQVTWLQPMFHATLTTSGDGIGVPDPTHPILHTPEELAWENYQDNGRTWEFNSDADASHFAHVIVREGSGNKQQDVLAVSKPGHFGNGTIVLTAWLLFSLGSPQNDDEAKSTLYNFLMHAFGSLYVDFGPRIPDHAEVASSSRMATAPNPVVKDERVLVRVVLYVFR